MRWLAMAAALTAAAAGAQEPAADPHTSADRFSLDLPANAQEPAKPADPAPAPAEAAPAEQPSGRFTLDTPIAELLANYRSKAVLDRELPGLSFDKNLDKFKALSLRRLQPLSGGRLTPELLEKVGKDLAAIE